MRNYDRKTIVEESECSKCGQHGKPNVQYKAAGELTGLGTISEFAHLLLRCPHCWGTICQMLPKDAQ